MHSLTESLQRIESYFVELQRLGSDSDRAQFFSTHPAILTASSVETLAARGTSLLRVDPRQAENLIRTAHWLSERLDDDFARGKAQRALANLAHIRGDQSQALIHYRNAKTLFAESGSDLEAAITASSSLQALVFQGRHGEALREADFARSIFERLGDRLRLARLNSNYANLLHHRDRWAEAARYYEAAYRDFLEVGEKQDVAVCLGNMAVCHQKRQDFSQALAFYQRTRDYCEENGLAALTADLDYNIAYLHYLRGQYTKALELYRETRTRHSELGDRHHVDLCALDEAEIYLELNLTGECADLAKVAYSGFRDRGLKLESAKALTILAVAENRQGKAFLALELLSQAQELFRQERNDVWAALIDLYRACVYSRAGRPFEGRRLGEAAAATFQRFALTTKAAACKVLLARVGVDQRAWSSARSSCVSALDTLGSIDAPALSFQASYLLGEVESATGNYPKALDHYLIAHEHLERTNGAIVTEEQRLPAIDDKLVLYESLVENLVEHPSTEDSQARAFSFVEKAKSRSLTDLLAFRAYALPATQSGRSKLADQVRQLREELNWYYRQIDLQEMRAEARSATEVEALRRYSRQQENRLIRTLSQLQQTDQEFSSVQEAFSVDVDALRSTLPEKTSLLEYFIAKGTVYAMVLDHSQLEIVPITLSSTVDELRRSLAASLTRTSSYSPAIGEALSAQYLRALYSELIEPVSHLMQGERLLIVPHGSLFYLPFHAFRVDDTFLADLFTVSYVPSATAYHLTRLKQTAVTAGDGALILSCSSPGGLELAATLAATISNVTVLSEDDVTEDAFREERPRARVIHLLTSGQMRDDNPMFSTVRFGRSSIHLFDLFQLRLESELVTVSGCSPGLRAEGKGNEIVGLVRSLLYAGARAVLTTLWSVDDSTWSSFARHFYPRVSRGDSLESALQASIASLRRERNDPRFWAPFVLFGDAR